MGWTDWATIVGGIASIIGAGLGLWAVRDARKTAEHLSNVRDSFKPQLALHYFGSMGGTLALRIRNSGIVPVKVNDILLTGKGMKGGVVFRRILIEPGTAPLVFPDETICSLLAADHTRPPSDLLSVGARDLGLFAHYEGNICREIRLSSEERAIIKREIESYCAGDAGGESGQSAAS